VPVRDLVDAIALSSGPSHICAARSSGGVACWGANEGGQLGDGSTGFQRLPVSVRELQGARDVAAGGAHTCAQRVDGKAVCWGSDDAGQLGDGTVPFEPRPTRVVGL
jgi:alpha-tubulin suppressor-like RCC1 family protein